MKKFLVLVLLLVPCIAFSAPDKYTKYVMETPVSIHDFAMYRVDNELNDIFKYENFKNKKRIHGSISKAVEINYYEDRDVYEIFIYFETYSPNRNKEQRKKSVELAKSLSEDLIKSTRSKLGLHWRSESGEYRGFNGKSHLSRYMKNAGYTHMPKPKDLEYNIDKKVRILVDIEFTEGYSYECSSMLLNPEMTCGGRFFP